MLACTTSYTACILIMVQNKAAISMMPTYFDAIRSQKFYIQYIYSSTKYCMFIVQSTIHVINFCPNCAIDETSLSTVGNR